ncbi:unnamed protein product, partial [Schistosoma margrebowiei]|uniref:Uncharacterized protein n=1 Tax=Schistosoma margrebowiei TaxID=48269 RepID=A0AA84ZBK4_9TREM
MMNYRTAIYPITCFDFDGQGRVCNVPRGLFFIPNLSLDSTIYSFQLFPFFCKSIHTFRCVTYI